MMRIDEAWRNDLAHAINYLCPRRRSQILANFGNFIANNEKVSVLVRDDNVLSIMQKDVTTFQEYRMSCHTSLRGAWT